MNGNYSTREYREKLYDDLHVRLRDTAISIAFNVLSHPLCNDK